jgi:hypothetical protein
MPLQKIVFKPGVNRENTRYTTEGGWYDCEKVRFRQGTPEKIGGWARISPYTYEGVCRSLWTWATIQGVVLTGVGTNLKFYIAEGGEYNDVTPIRSFATLSGPFAATSGSSVVTVTDSAHGVADGDYVTFNGAQALSIQTFTRSTATEFTLTTALATNTAVILSVSGGTLPDGLYENTVYYIKVVSGTLVNFTDVPDGAAVDTSGGAGSGTFSLYVSTGITAAVLNQTHQITLIDANSYTIDVSATASVYDTGNGGTTVNASYQIPVGYEVAQPLAGWGAGPWGTGPWGIGTPAFISLRLWYQNNFGEDLIYGYRGGPLYYWSASTGVSPMQITATLDQRTVTGVNTGTEYLTVSTASLSNGLPVKFSSSGGTLPAGLSAGTVYYIININGAGANTLQVSTTLGGTAVDLTSVGSGTISMFGPTLFTVSGSYPEAKAIQLTSTGTLPTPLVIGTVYYTYDSTGPTFYLSTSSLAEPIVCTDNSSTTTYSVLPNGIPVTSLAYASDVPVVVNFMMVSDISRFTIAFGCNPIGSTDIDPMLVRWSDQESVVNWTPVVTNQAGGQRLSHGSEIVTAVQARQEIVVFTDTSVYAMQYLGPPYVWGFQLLGDNISIISPNAAIIASGVVYWMGVDKFYRYDGRTQTMRCDLRQYIYSDINMEQTNQFFCGTSEGFNEVWWFYCSASSDTIDRYVSYNYQEDIWTYGTMERTAWVDSGLNQYPVAATYSNNLVYHENGVDDNVSGTPVAIDAYISSAQFDIGDGHAFGFVWRLIPDITFRGSTASNPQVVMTLQPAQNSGSGYNVPESLGGSSDAAVVRSAVVPIEQFTGQVLIRVRGRQMSFKVESTDLGVQWQLGAPRIDIRPDGRRGNT